MYGSSVSICPYCVAGCPGCEYGATLFRRAQQIIQLIPETWPDVPTSEQVAAMDEWYRIGDAYCAHIGQPVGRDRGV